MNAIYRKYLSSVAGICFDKPDDQNKKTPQQLAAEERNKIPVVKTEEDKTPEQIEADKKVVDEAAVKEAEEKAAKEAEEAKKKADEEEAKKKAEGGEGDEEVVTDEVDPEKLKKTIERLQKRVDKLTAKNKLTETEKEELATKLKSIDAGKATLTEEDVEKRADEKANQKVATRDFVDTCNRLADAANKIDKNFGKKVDAMAEEIGPIPGTLIGVLGDLDNGGAVLNYLSDNVDEAERIYGMSAGRMGVALTKISTELVKEAEAKKKSDEEKAKKPAKEISKVPDHKEPPSGTAKTDNILRDDEPIEDWMTKRNRQAQERRKLKYG